MLRALIKQRAKLVVQLFSLRLLFEFANARFTGTSPADTHF